MEEKNKQLLIRGAIVGGVVGSAIVAVKSKSTLSSYFTKCYSTTTDILKFLNENKDDIVAQLKTTSDKVTKVIDSTNHDLKALSDNIKHLKSSTSEMVSTVQETKDQLVGMYQTCVQKFDEETDKEKQETENE